MNENASFEGYAVVELMGHNKEIGYVKTEYFGGPALFRIDQPALPEREYELTRSQWVGDQLCAAGTKMQRAAIPGKTVFVGPQAVFRLTPCSEETVKRAVDELIPAPVKILHLVEQKRIERTEPPDTDLDPDTHCGQCGQAYEYCECAPE